MENHKDPNLMHALCLDKTCYNKLYEHRDTCDYDVLEAARTFPSESYDVWCEISKSKFCRYQYDLDILKRLSKYTSPHKLVKYLESQNSNDENSRGILMTYDDYIKMSIQKNEFDRKNTMILFPKYLEAEHQRLVEWQNEQKEQIRANELRMLDDLLDEYHKQFDFLSGDSELMIVAPNKANDIVQEGQTQHICVGGRNMPYIKDMAHKKTAILFIRKKSDPETPYYTMEVRDQRIAQVRGKYNCSPSPDVKALVDEYAREKKLAVGY